MSAEPSDFERQTAHIRKWTNHELVPSVPLASELLAWYHHVTQDMGPSNITTVMGNAFDLLRDLHKDDDG